MKKKKTYPIDGTVVDLQSGDEFKMPGKTYQFHSVRERGTSRKVRCVTDNADGTITVTTTSCGEEYTMGEDTPITLLG